MTQETKGKKEVEVVKRSKIFTKNNQEFTHHLFKADVRDCLKNISWKKDHFLPESIAHTHIYHTVNSQGHEQQYTAPVGGHFHEVIWQVHPDGTISSKCGPALRKVWKKRPDGSQRSVIEEITYFDGYENKTFRDDHTHEMNYLGKEDLVIQTNKNQMPIPMQQVKPAGFQEGTETVVE